MLKTCLIANAKTSRLAKAILVLLVAYAAFSSRFSLAQHSPPVAHVINENAILVTGLNSNVLVINSSEGLILVDGGHADWYHDLRGLVASYFPDSKIRALFNTHWHADQTGANQPLAAEGVEIIAHENTMLWLSTEVAQRGSGKVYPPLPSQALPSTTFRHDGSIKLGDRLVQYGHPWNAHTDGDLWVYFEDDNILVTGGFVSNGRWPEIDWWTGGYIGAMLDGFAQILDIPNEETVIIPAYGEPMNIQDLRQQNQMYLTIFDRLHGLFIKSNSLEDILAAGIAAEYEAEMGDSTQFLTQAYQSFIGRIRDPQNFRILNFP
jgi:cyclase